MPTEEQRAEFREKMRRYRSGKTNVVIDTADIEQLRALAAALGFTISRGHGVGGGNPGAFMERLVALDRAYPERLRALLHDAFALADA